MFLPGFLEPDKKGGEKPGGEKPTGEKLQESVAGKSEISSLDFLNIRKRKESIMKIIKLIKIANCEPYHTEAIICVIVVPVVIQQELKVAWLFKVHSVQPTSNQINKFKILKVKNKEFK